MRWANVIVAIATRLHFEHTSDCFRSMAGAELEVLPSKSPGKSCNFPWLLQLHPDPRPWSPAEKWVPLMLWTIGWISSPRSKPWTWVSQYGRFRRLSCCVFLCISKTLTLVIPDTSMWSPGQSNISMLWEKSVHPSPKFAQSCKPSLISMAPILCQSRWLSHGTG